MELLGSESLHALDFAWDLGSKTLNPRPLNSRSLDPNFMDRICVSRPEAKKPSKPEGAQHPWIRTQGLGFTGLGF